MLDTRSVASEAFKLLLDPSDEWGRSFSDASHYRTSVGSLYLAPVESAQRWIRPGPQNAASSDSVGAAIVFEQSGCDVVRPTEVDQFFANDDSLVVLTLRAMTQLGARLAGAVSFRCEIVTDPEETASPVFVLTARTTSSPTDALRILDEFDETWWLDASRGISGKMVVTLEYV